MRPRRVVVLCDNETSRPDVGCEWGLSMALDLGEGADGGLWLWDTGRTALFLDNARVLGLDLARLTGVALSHGHYDHTGGLAALAETGYSGPIYGHPSCPLPRYALKDGRAESIGPPRPLPQLIPAGALTPLAPGLALVADIPRRAGSFQATQGFALDPHGHDPDHVPDDAFLVLDGADGPVLILGCCHSGLANSLACARERLGLLRVHTVMGGLHLYKAGPEALEETARSLEEFGVRRLIAGHCTGPDRLAHLRGRLCARMSGLYVLPLAAGQVWAV